MAAHLPYTGRKEFFAGLLKELLLCLRGQVPTNLGNEDWGLEEEKGVRSEGEGAGGGHSVGTQWCPRCPRMALGWLVGLEGGERAQT